MSDNKNGLTVVSLFDGMSCGMIALDRLNIPVKSYYSSEIEKHAITVSDANYPSIVRLGDVRGISRDNIDGQVDLLLGGSPCQGFSFIGKRLNFNDTRSALFFEYLRLLRELKPRYFLLENVMMNKESSKYISDLLGVQPIVINSSLFTAQNRVRLYWTNIPQLPLPDDRGITLDDVITHDSSLTYNYPKVSDRYLPVGMATPEKYICPYNRKVLSHKSTTLRLNVNNGNMWVYDYHASKYRNLHSTEAEKLQGVPVGYTSSVSQNAAKKMLGNGWTIDVICHILQPLKQIYCDVSTSEVT